MKKFILAIILFSGLAVQAQKKIQKEIKFQEQPVEVDLALANSIEFKTWNKSLIQVDASVETEDPQDAERYELEVREESGGIRIVSNSEKIFKDKECGELVINRTNEVDLNYVIYVPEDIQLEVSSIIGNVTSEYLKGDIEINLVTGNINIIKFEGDLDLRTVTGKISLPAKDSSFKATTVMGKIRAADDLKVEKKDQFLGEEIALHLKGSKNRLNLKTVTGDIFLQ
ncbi:hypothetical protein SAMN04488034_10548 [Salinimicrobium catena]|uniref:Adhesin domain-containing protein n=1 Tax=Salinimicrobium catena TaxID=390640 RepID=A0A1H5NP20_9FLAO|nr:hypothetical protein [Salinimicrobium catena]SDL55757.1 hypothetical protein SAMN04488140_105113 [Salinimicrobium catena]SEF03419.1 hypothetical protein SAMN04488034_10548 [Salinimicrobium catena]